MNVHHQADIRALSAGEFPEPGRPRPHWRRGGGPAVGPHRRERPSNVPPAVADRYWPAHPGLEPGRRGRRSVPRRPVLNSDHARDRQGQANSHRRRNSNRLARPSPEHDSTPRRRNRQSISLFDNRTRPRHPHDHSSSRSSVRRRREAFRPERRCRPAGTRRASTCRQLSACGRIETVSTTFDATRTSAP